MASPLGEIITLQFGPYANWSGAHFWNFQVRASASPHSNTFHSPCCSERRSVETVARVSLKVPTGGVAFDPSLRPSLAG